MAKLIKKPRARDLGLPFPGKTGRYNAITDVAGVRVGFTTLTDASRGIRTGVTAIVPRNERGEPAPVAAGFFALNGNGEMTGTHWIEDAGYFLGPVCISNTHSIGAVHHGVTQWMIKRHAGFYKREHAWAMPVVAETYDGVLNDINGQHVHAGHAIAAIASAKSGPVAEGSSGGGNGMIAYEFKGGTGTASRMIVLGNKKYTLGALVQANHGLRPWLTILGKPVGKAMNAHRLKDKESGSVIVIIATDAPLSSLSLRHLARRAAIGIGRGGTPGGNSSGDLFLAFSVANRGRVLEKTGLLIEKTEINNEYLDPLYLAVVEATEEAVINALVAGEDVATFKPKGRICKAIDTGKLAAMFKQ